MTTPPGDPAATGATRLGDTAPAPGPGSAPGAAGSPGGPPGDGVEYEWRRLSNRMLIGQPVLELLRNWIALLGLLVAGRSSGHLWWSLAGLGLTIIVGLLRWFTTTFRVTDDQVQLRRGLINRKLLSVPLDRVRTFDVTANAMHRILGLTRITIGTGRSDRDQGLRLDGLTLAETARLREELLHARAQGEAAVVQDPAVAGPGDATEAGTAAAATEAPAHAAETGHARGPVEAGGTPVSYGDLTAPLAGAPAEVELARLRSGWLRFGPFTLTGITAVLAAGGVFWRLVNEAGIDVTRSPLARELAERATHVPIMSAVIVLLIALVVLIALASTAGYVLKFWRFRLTRNPGGTLHVTRGLLTTRATTIEERRLRGVEVSDGLPLRLAGGARCGAIATGLRHSRGGSVLLPPAPAAEAARVAGEVLGTRAPLAVEPIAHGPAARRRRFTRALGVAALLVAAAALLWRLGALPAWTWQATLVALPCAALLAADRYRALGHALADGHLVSRQGSLRRRRSVLACDGIIGWNVRRSFFQRRAGLATLVATTAAGAQRYDVPDVGHSTALRLADQATPGLLTPFLVQRARPGRAPEE